MRVEVEVDDCSAGDNDGEVLRFAADSLVNLVLSSAQLILTHASPAALVQPAQLVGGTQTHHNAELNVWIWERVANFE